MSKYHWLGAVMLVAAAYYVGANYKLGLPVLG